jgi:hypothetical protein
MVFQDDGRAVNEPAERLPRLEQARHAHVPSWRLSPVVEALQALCGVQLTVAVTTVAERGDWTRVDNPGQLLDYVGLTPSASSRGPRRRQGSMTTAGKTHARRALVEGAWAYRYPAQVSCHLPRRRETQPQVIQAISWKAHGRLCKRSRTLLARGKHANQGVVAMARERIGFMWAMANEVTVTPSVHKTASQCTKQVASLQRASAETLPRCGATLVGVKRPTGLLVPRVRQAPDGRTSGGRPSTASSRINRRMFLAPSLPLHHSKGKAG